MSKFLFTNFGSAQLGADVAELDNEITVAVGQGALFPEPDNSKGEIFAVVLRKNTGEAEIMHCWQRVGDTLSVLRGREGTAIMAWETVEEDEDVYVSLRTTAGALNNWGQAQIGGLAIRPQYMFAGTVARDNYFTANPTELVHGVIVQCGTQFYSRITPYSGLSYWQEITPLIAGPQGPVGDSTAPVLAARDDALDDIEDARVAAISDVQDETVEAVAAKELAQAAANFIGPWSALAGALNRPASVVHSGAIWALNNDVLLVENHEPTTFNSNWTRVAVIGETLTWASKAQAEAGTDNTTVMSPLRTKEAVAAHRPYCSQAEAEAMTNTTKMVTPANVLHGINAKRATYAQAYELTNSSVLMTPQRTNDFFTQKITVSTANPSGTPANHQLWLKY
jgi:hypothetical protein